MVFIPRCECGYLIWPWQARVVDVELGWIHESCAGQCETEEQA